MQTIKLSKLNYSVDLPHCKRHGIPHHHIGNLVDALRCNRELDPILVSRGDNEVVDGFCRCMAYEQVHGTNVSVPVRFKTFKSYREKLLAYSDANAIGKRPLTTPEKLDILIEVEENGWSVEEFSLCLSWTLEKTQRYLVERVAHERGSGKQFALKTCTAHLAGKTLTKTQRAASEMLYDKTINHSEQIVIVLENNLIDHKRTDLIESLTNMHCLLGAFLKKV